MFFRKYRISAWNAEISTVSCFNSPESRGWHRQHKYSLLTNIESDPRLCPVCRCKNENKQSIYNFTSLILKCECVIGKRRGPQFDREFVPCRWPGDREVTPADGGPCAWHNECPAVRRLQLPPADNGQDGSADVSQVGRCQLETVSSKVNSFSLWEKACYCRRSSFQYIRRLFTDMRCTCVLDSGSILLGNS